MLFLRAKYGFPKKVKKQNLLASEPKNIIKKHKKHKNRKLLFLIFFEQNALKLCVLKSEMCVIPMLNVGISKQMSINQDHIKASLRGREAIL